MNVDIETIKRRLETASNDDEHDSPSIIIISKLYDQIRSLKNDGLSWAKIVNLINTDGIEIKPNTFSAAFSRYEKRRKSEERKRKKLENKSKPKAEKPITTLQKPTNRPQIEGMVTQVRTEDL